MKRAPVLVLLLVAAIARGQGFYTESTVSGHPGEVEKFYYMPGMLKSIGEDGKNITIVRLDKETIYRIDPENKTYSAITFAQVESKIGKSRAMLDDMMAKRLAALPPDKREKMKQMMSANQGAAHKAIAPPQITKTGESKTISGYPCTKYVMSRNGKPIETIWTTTKVGEFESVKEDMAKFLDRVSTMTGSKHGMNEWIKGIDGFPIQTESSGNIHTVTRLDRKAIPQSEFDVPSGFTEKQDEMMQDAGD